MQRYNSINILRVVATLMVFFLHSTLFVGRDFPMSDILAEAGWTFIFFTPAWGGVWIFFVLAGYLAGRGFAAGRYDFSWRSITRYYWRKLQRVFFPVVCFVIVAGVVTSFDILLDMSLWRRIFTFSYDGSPSINAISATWFVSTLMWLYVMAPLLARLVSRVKTVGRLYLLLGVVGLAGLGVRLCHYVLRVDYFHVTYVSSLCNLDVFLGGMIVAYIVEKTAVKATSGMHSKLAISLVLALFILLNTFMSAHQGMLHFHAIYTRIFPTAYLLLIGCYLYVFAVHSDCAFRGGRCARALNEFSTISFEFYLLHSMVFDRVASFIGGNTAIAQYLTIVPLVFTLTLLFSVGLHRAFYNVKSSGKV